MLLDFKYNVTVVKQMGKLPAVDYQLDYIFFCGERIFPCLISNMVFSKVIYLVKPHLNIVDPNKPVSEEAH